VSQRDSIGVVYRSQVNSVWSDGPGKAKTETPSSEIGGKAALLWRTERMRHLKVIEITIDEPRSIAIAVPEKSDHRLRQPALRPENCSASCAPVFAAPPFGPWVLSDAVPRCSTKTP